MTEFKDLIREGTDINAVAASFNPFCLEDFNSTDSSTTITDEEYVTVRKSIESGQYDMIATYRSSDHNTSYIFHLSRFYAYDNDTYIAFYLNFETTESGLSIHQLTYYSNLTRRLTTTTITY